MKDFEKFSLLQQGETTTSDGTSFPEVERRNKEILEIMYSLSEEEKRTALRYFAITKWHRLNTATPDYKPNSEPLEIIGK
jgi:hypothetical protein